MKFTHIADAHLGAWKNHPELFELQINAFKQAVEESIEEKTDFVIIAGDLLHSALPDVLLLERVIQELKKLKKKNIPVYAVPGSHDFSPSGKTMLNVLEKAELLNIVSKGEIKDGVFFPKFTKDEKTGVLISGMIGRKGALEAKIYENINYANLGEEGTKIFVFHSALSELGSMPVGQSISLSDLPKGFDYYAAGHIHEELEHDYGNGKIIYPGPLYPDDYTELEKLGKGSFVVVELGKKLERKNVKSPEVEVIWFDANGKNANQVEEELKIKCESVESRGKIVVIKIEGTLSQGRPSDIDLDRATASLQDAFSVKKNTYNLQSMEFREIKKSANKSVSEIENDIIEEHHKGDQGFVKSMMDVLSNEKHEDETNPSYQERIKHDLYKTLGIEDES